MNEEVLRILKMVEEGKLDASKGAELIEALNANKLPEKYVTPANTISNDGMMLKIKVISAQKDNVNIKLPIKFIKGVIAACGKIPVDVHGMEAIDTKMLLEAIDSGLTGKIVDVQSANGDIVEVVIE